MQNKTYTRLLQILGIIILLIFTFSFNFKETADSLKKIDFFWIIVFIFFWFAIIFIKAILWKILVKNVAVVEISIVFAMVSVVAGISAGAFFPGRIDVARPLMLKKDYGVPLDTSLSAVIVEKVLFFTSLILVFLFSLLYFISSSYVDLAGLIYFSLLILLLFVFLLITDFKIIRWFFEKVVSIIPFSKRKKKIILNSVKELLKTFKTIKNQKSTVTFSVLFFFLWLIDIVKIYSVFLALNIEIEIELIAFSYFASTVFGLATLIPGGIGVSEVSQSIIIRNIDDSLDINLVNTAILVFRTIYYYTTILLGSVILIAFSSRPNEES